MKRFRVRFINEEAVVQPATVAADVDTQEETTEDIAQETDLVANATPTLQEQDVDGLEDKDVMNYVYFNAPQDIDDSTRQALFNRADQIRQKQMNGSTTPKDQEEFAKGVIAAAAQSKNKAKLGESLDYGVQAWIKALTGKSGKKGRDGSANWIGDDIYDEVEKTENGRIHYYNNWIGKVDRENKIIYINDQVAPRGTVHNLIQAAHFMNYKAKRTHETRELIDMGYEDDDFDPMYTESYTSGRVDTFDEPYYGGGESDWGIDEEDSTYRASHHTPSKEHEEFMRGEDSQRIDLLSELKEAVSDRIDDLTDGEIDADDVYDFVSDYIDNAHKKYTIEELKKFSKIYKGKVDFFAKTILAKYKKRNGKEEQEERFLSDEDIVDIKRELVNKVANELDDEFGYEIDKFDIDVHYFVGVFLKDNPNIFGRVLSKKNSDDWYISGADVQSVLKEALPSFRRKIAFMKKVGKN